VAVDAIGAARETSPKRARTVTYLLLREENVAVR
jgi:hypothetical protein